MFPLARCYCRIGDRLGGLSSYEEGNGLHLEEREIFVTGGGLLGHMAMNSQGHVGTLAPTPL